MMTHNSHHHAHASLRCAAAQPNRLVETSGSSAWTSLLIDHLQGQGRSELFETARTADLTLVVALAGRHEVEVLAGGRWRSALYQHGSAGMTPPGETTRLRWQTPSERQAFRTAHIYLPGTLVDALADDYRRIGQDVHLETLSALAFRDQAVTMQACALLEALRDSEPDLYASGAAIWLATHLLSRQAGWRHVADDSRRSATITDRRLARVIEYMSAHLDRPLTLDDLAAEAGISVHHFGRRFRESTGLGPSCYLTGLRMAQARLLLRSTDLPIVDIGIRCGYPRPTAFATAFKQHVGVTASSYRMSP